MIPAMEDGESYPPLLTHSMRVCLTVLAIGSRLYSREALANLVLGALLHDVGHLFHPSWETMQPDELDLGHPKHQQKGFDLLMKARRLSATTSAICIQHHERLDGTGEPKGLYEYSIHAYSRLTAVADQFDTLAFGSRTPNSREAIRKIQEDAGIGLDPFFTQIFLSRVTPYPPGVPVTLKSGHRAVSVRPNPDHADRPLVRVLLPDNEARDLDLAEDRNDEIEAASWSNSSVVEEVLR
jgi:HD-GYP domain-containing protein (c-di-GMP phosphodiesterase class II)